MTEIYIMRHGETEWNRQDRVLGRTDIPLNETGRRQAAQAAERLREERFDEIWVSPLSRAEETGRAVLACQGERCIFKTEPRLLEQNFGIYEGAPRSDPEYQAEKRRYFSRHQGGESYLDMAARVYPMLEELARDYGGKRILLVTHGGVCRIITSYFTDVDNETFARFVLENCQTRRFVLPRE